MMRRKPPRLVLALTLCACGASRPTPDAGLKRDAGASVDAGSASDAGAFDAGTGTSLFNGSDLTGWELFLGTTGETGADGGLIERDPHAIFSVVTLDGEPAIRISGRTWGALISNEEYESFELTLEYRWGAAIYPPLGFRDSGLMYWSVGARGAVNAGGPQLAEPPGSGGFMISVESQIAPNDVGTAYSLGPISFRSLGRTPQVEAPLGQWNALKIIAGANRSEHHLNGQRVCEQEDFMLALPAQPAQPLRRGKLQLQSEGSEIFFRRIHLERLP